MWRPDKESWIAALRFSTVGLEFGIGAALGYWAGSWLDERYGTKPYLALVLLLLGIAAAFASLIRRVREIQREQDGKSDNDSAE